MQLASNLSLLMGKYRYSIQDVHKRTGLARKTISALYNDKKQPLHIAIKKDMQ